MTMFYEIRGGYDGRTSLGFYKSIDNAKKALKMHADELRLRGSVNHFMDDETGFSYDTIGWDSRRVYWRVYECRFED